MKETNDKYTVVLASNNKGVLPLCVTAWSLLNSAAPETSYRVCVLSDGMGESEKSKVKNIFQMMPNRHSLEIIELDPFFNKISELDEICGNWPRSAWARIFIPDILPDVKRVLYLDIDMLVCDDCRPLFHMDMKGAAIGAVNERVSVAANKKLGIPPEHPEYFNSGTLLMDLEIFRRDNLAKKLLEYAMAHKNVISYPDQDSLNGVLYNSVIRLHPRWNWNDIGTRKILTRKPASPKLIRAATFREAVEASFFPGIIHYCGQYKPWEYNYHITRHLYERAIRQSGVKGFDLSKGKNFRIFMLRLLYAPLSWLTWLKVRRMIKKYGIVTPPPPNT